MEFIERNYDDIETYFYFLNEINADIENLSDDELEDLKQQLIQNDKQYLEYIVEEASQKKKVSKWHAILNSCLFAVSAVVLGLVIPQLILFAGFPLITLLINLSNLNTAKYELKMYKENAEQLEEKIFEIQQEQEFRYVANKENVKIDERLEKLRARYEYFEEVEEELQEQNKKF